MFVQTCTSSFFYTLVVAIFLGAAGAQESAPRLGRRLESDPTAALRLARMDGKYQMLLHQFKVDEPGEQRIIDRGLQQRTEYRGHKGLPKGLWVYVRPYWFIWREEVAAVKGNVPRSWGPEQVCGKPDSFGGRDRQTAWAAKTENNPKAEWIVAEFDGVIKGTAVKVHESFHPGAVAKVTIFKPDGEELVVWRAKKVAPFGKSSRMLTVPLPLGFHVGRVKLYLETGKVKGWNEIDAIGVVDDKGREHWATVAMASTTWAPSRGGALLPGIILQPVQPKVPMIPVPQPDLRLAQRVAKVAAENQRLKARVAALERELEQLRRAVGQLRDAKKR